MEVVSTTGGCPGDFHGFSGGADLQGDVQAEDLIQVERNALAHIFLEALLDDINLIGAHGYLDEEVVAVDAGVRITGHVGGFVDQRDFGGGHGAAARVGDRAANAAAGALRAGKWRGRQNRQNWDRNQKKAWMTEG